MNGFWDKYPDGFLPLSVCVCVKNKQITEPLECKPLQISLSSLVSQWLQSLRRTSTKWGAAFTLCSSFTWAQMCRTFIFIWHLSMRGATFKKKKKDALSLERERKHVVNPAGGFENVLLCCWSDRTTEMCRMCRGTSAICMFLLSSLCEPLSLICLSLPSGASVNQKNSQVCQVCFNHFLPYKMFAKPDLPILTCIFLPFSEMFSCSLWQSCMTTPSEPPPPRLPCVPSHACTGCYLKSSCMTCHISMNWPKRWTALTRHLLRSELIFRLCCHRSFIFFADDNRLSVREMRFSLSFILLIFHFHSTEL